MYFYISTSTPFYSRGKEAQQTPFLLKQVVRSSKQLLDTSLTYEGCLYLCDGLGSNKLKLPWEQDRRQWQKAGIAVFSLNLMQRGSSAFFSLSDLALFLHLFLLCSFYALYLENVDHKAKFRHQEGRGNFVPSYLKFWARKIVVQGRTGIGMSELTTPES